MKWLWRLWPHGHAYFFTGARFAINTAWGHRIIVEGQSCLKCGKHRWKP
jgi:ABC-type nitrate/sulfonate/bicarbonate transport system permease component